MHSATGRAMTRHGTAYAVAATFDSILLVENATAARPNVRR
jgi:hypothetical protein